ncbi:MAG: YdcF family protein [Pseudomonadota bacterium]
MRAIVILGAAVGPNGPSPSLSRRAHHGAKLFKEGAGDLLVPCGGLGIYPPTEAEAIQYILLAEGVPADVIRCDHNSQSTYENIINARAILRAERIRDAIIVTDSLHAPRAILTARFLGLRAEADTPSIRNMPMKTRLRRFRHEALALPVYIIRLPFWLWRDRRR